MRRFRFELPHPKRRAGMHILRRPGEHAVEMARHLLAMRIESGHECGVIAEAHRVRDQRLVVAPRGQFVGLGVVEVLQAMLQPAQEIVGCAQFAHDLRRKLPLFLQQRQNFQGRADLQIRIASAAYQLEGLRDEFDFAYAARAELDMPREIAPRDLGADLSMQRTHRRERAEVQVLAEHERPGNR